MILERYTFTKLVNKLSLLYETDVDSEFATVEYRPDKNVVVARMTAYAEGDEFRDYMHSVTEAVEDTGCPNVLADTRDHPPLSQED